MIADGWGEAEGTGREARAFLCCALWHFAHYPIAHPSACQGGTLLDCNKMKLHLALLSSSSITERSPWCSLPEGALMGKASCKQGNCSWGEGPRGGAQHPSVGLCWQLEGSVPLCWGLSRASGLGKVPWDAEGLVAITPP